MQDQFSRREKRSLMNRETVTQFIDGSFDPYADKRKYGREKRQGKMTFLEKMNTIKNRKGNEALAARLWEQLRGKQQSKIILKADYLSLIGFNPETNDF